MTASLALRLWGYKVTIVARELPGDQSSNYTSPWAGANWCSFVDPAEPNMARNAGFDALTFRVWLALEQQGLVSDQELVLAPFEDKAMKELPWFAHLAPDFTWDKAKGASSYKSHLLNVPEYTKWLVRQLTTPGDVPAKLVLATLWGVPLPIPVGPPVQFMRSDRVDSLAAAVVEASTQGKVDGVVNASGLGAGKLADVMDEKVFPIRGQVAVVRSERLAKAPQCAMAVVDKHSASEYTPAVGYIIPRAKSGNVICGGTFTEHSFDDTVDPRTQEAILRNAVQICPDLLLAPDIEGAAAERARAQIKADPESWRKLASNIVSAHAGLRPARKGGPRIEIGRPVGPSGVPSVHAYGLGPSGYQASMGTANLVSKLIREQVPVLAATQSKL